MAIHDGVGAHLEIFGGGAPTLAAGSNAGTSPPAPVLIAGSTDTRGRCTFGTGSIPALGNQVVVTFAQAYSVAPVIDLTAENATTAALQLGVASVTAQGFTIVSGVAPAAAQANTVYAAAWSVIG